MLAPLGAQEGKLSTAEKQLKQLAKKAHAVETPLPGPIRARKERQAGCDCVTISNSWWCQHIRSLGAVHYVLCLRFERLRPADVVFNF